MIFIHKTDSLYYEMKVFYSNKYKNHKGFKSSFENELRVSNIIQHIPSHCVIEDDLKNIIISDSWLEIIQSLEQKYKDIRTWNCVECTFENTKMKCDLCMSSKGDIKIISNINGDTTYMCSKSIDTVISLLKTIIYVIEWQQKTDKDSFIL